MEQVVRQILIDDLGWTGDTADLTADLDLIEAGVIDSMGILQLVEILEERHGCYVPDDDLVPENFTTVGAIARLLEA